MGKRQVHIEVIARGLATRGREILVCRNVKRSYCFLPGGHVETGESAAGALRREFLEETGLRVRVGELLCVSEGSFRQQGRSHHEINFVFHVEPPMPGGREIGSQERAIEFVWIPSDQLGAHDFRPPALRGWIRSAGLRRGKAGKKPGCALLSHMA